MRLDKHLYNEMRQHALEAFPEECCGFILYDTEADREIVRRIRNVATERHQKDPASFPRDGRDGYIMDERELLEINNALDAQTHELRAIYHSHPNGKAYFSPAGFFVHDLEEHVPRALRLQHERVGNKRGAHVRY